MKRRSLLRTMVAMPGMASALAAGAVQKDVTAARDKGLPAGPPLVPPGGGETPTIPVMPAAQLADDVIGTFGPEQMRTLSKLGELLAPAWNGNPGAGECGAAEFLDFLVACSGHSRIELYKNGLDDLNRQSQQKFGIDFDSITSQQAVAILAPLREPWTYANAASRDDVKEFLVAAKGDFLRATVNSWPYINALSQTRRPRDASEFYWNPMS